MNRNYIVFNDGLIPTRMYLLIYNLNDYMYLHIFWAYIRFPVKDTSFI